MNLLLLLLLHQKSACKFTKDFPKKEQTVNIFFGKTIFELIIASVIGRQA